MKLRALFATLAPLTIAIAIATTLYQTPQAAETEGAADPEYLPDSTVLATVGDRDLTILDFRNGYFSSDINFRPTGDEQGRIEFLNSMVNKEVLALVAKEANRPFGFEDRLKVRETEDKTLANVLFFRRVFEPATATEEEMLAIYPQFSRRLHLRHILFERRDVAERVRRVLRSGSMTWSAAVREYSISPDRDNDGDLGWRNRLSLRGDLGIKAFDLNPGAVSEVAQNLEGYHVLQCLDREPVKPLPFKTLKRVISEDIRSARTLKLLQAYYEELSTLTTVTYDTTQIMWAVDQFKDFEVERMDPHRNQTASGQRVIELSSPTPVFPAADLNRVVATIGGRDVTLDEFMKGYRLIPSPVRRKLLGLDAFVVTLNGIIFEPQMVEFARASGVDKDPRTVAEVEKRTEQIRVEHLFADSIMSQIRITDDELQQHYKEREHEFVTIPRALYARIGRTSEAGADSVLARLDAGETAAEILAADSLTGLYLGSIEEIRQTDGSNVFEGIVFSELKPGQSTKIGPDMKGNYVVVQVIESFPSQPLAFSEVRSIVDESVRNAKAESLLNALLDRHRTRYRIVSHPDLLMRIRLVDPALDI